MSKARTLASLVSTGNILADSAVAFSELTGSASVAQGGTGQTSLTSNNVILGNGTSAVQFVAPSTSGNVLTSNGTTWVSQSITGGATLSDDTTTNATYYPTFATATSGTMTTAKVSSTKLTFNPSTGAFTIAGTLSATSKSFLITHPTKPGMSLQYGSLEGPENGVYFRGRSTGKIIVLPDYWKALVDPKSITVNLTPVGSYRTLYVVSINDAEIHIDNAENAVNIDYFYTIFAERKDIEKLKVEF